MRGLYGAYGRTLTRTAGRNPRHVFEVNITKRYKEQPLPLDRTKTALSFISTKSTR